jgi:hypothetical protein
LVPLDGMKASTPKKLHKPNSTTTRLNRLGKGLRVRIVTDANEIKSFDERLAQQHYLGATPPVGDFLRQVVEREGQAVGQLVWGAASLKVKDRDVWIGWTPSQRAERLKLVVQNRRYLLLHPKGQEPNLASQALAAACRALPEQWQEQFGYRPLLAETFSDVESFAGTCYKASGWEPVGLTKGHSRHRADFYVPNGRPKKLWMKELCPAGRQKANALHLEDTLQQALTPPPNGLLPLNPQQSRSLWEVLRKVPDPRASNTRFRIGSVLTLVVMALLSGARDVSQIARFATRLQPKQRAALNLPIKKGTRRFYEVPGYSVFYDLLKRLDPEVLAEVLNGWLREHAGTLPSGLSLDGKMIRDVIGTVTLADHQNGSPVALAIMDQKEGTQRCEQTAALALIQSLPTLEGQTLTADPLHCQREVAKAVVGKGGEYLFQIKANQKKLFAHARRQCNGVPPLLSKPLPATVESMNEA